MRSQFDPETTQQIDFNFRGGFCDTFEEEEQEFEEEISRALSSAFENENSLITAITVEEYKLNFSDIVKSLIKAPQMHILELNLRCT